MEKGDRLGRYELVAALGRGGTGEVWEAVLHGPQGFRKAVALKVLRDPQADEEHRRALVLEARLGGLLAHPNVVSTLELGFLDGGRVFVAMELVRGASVARLVETGPLPAGALLDVGIAAAEALDHVHGLEVSGRRAQLVHRDVKPGNLLVDRSGVVKLADLGIARWQGGGGLAAGTPGYMPPEQTDGREDARSDLFALGATLVVLATGRRPFGTGPTALAEVRRVEERLADPTFLAGVDAAAPGLAPIVARCLRHDPDLRWATAADLADALRTLRRSASPGPSLLELLGRVRPELRRGRRREESASTVAAVNLPAAADAFVGRDELKEALAHRIRAADARLVTVVGPGGMGKTRLVVEFARAEARAWPGGVWFVDLADAATAEAVTTAVARTLGIPLDEDLADRVGHALRARGRALVVLDNFEQVAEHAAATVGAWVGAAPEAVFVVTSRVVLKIRGEVVLAVGPLAPADAVRLFALRAHAPILDDEQATVERIVEALDGMPLAIELAAARTRVLPLPTILQRLADRFRLLAGAGPDRPDRHRSLRASLEGSWELLQPYEQAALAQLTVFEGPFPLAAAEAVVDLRGFPDPPWTLDVIERLCDQSLLRSIPDEDAFHLLVTVRAFAAERLEPAARDGAELRHAGYFASLASRAMTGRNARDHARSRADLEAAFDRAVAHGEGGVAAGVFRTLATLIDQQGPLNRLGPLTERLLAVPGLVPRDESYALTTSARALHDQGRFDDALARLRRAVELAADDSWLRAAAHSLLGRIHRRLGDRPTALAMQQAALDDARRTGAADLVSAALLNLGNHHMEVGRPDEARRYFDAALIEAREGGVQRIVAWVYGALGSCVRDQDARQAEAFYRQAIAEAEPTGDRRYAARLRGNLALVLGDQGRVTEARAIYEQVLAEKRAVGDRGPEATTLYNIGVLLAESDRPAAIAHLEQALAIHREVGDRRSESGTLGALADVLTAGGRVEEGLGLYEEALRLARLTSDRRGEAHLLGNVGLAHRVSGDLERGRRSLEEALALHREVKNRRGEGGVLANLGLVHLDLGNAASARERFEAAIAIHRESGNRRSEGIALSLLGSLAASGRAGFAAEAMLRTALAIHREVANRVYEAHTLAELGGVLAGLGRHPEARAALDEALLLVVRHGSPGDAVQVHAHDARVRLARGDLPGAKGALAEAQRLMGSLPRGVPRTVERRLLEVEAAVERGR